MLDVMMESFNVDGWLAPKLPSLWHTDEYDVAGIGYLEEELVLAVPRSCLQATEYYAETTLKNINDASVVSCPVAKSPTLRMNLVKTDSGMHVKLVDALLSFDCSTKDGDVKCTPSKT